MRKGYETEAKRFDKVGVDTVKKARGMKEGEGSTCGTLPFKTPFRTIANKALWIRSPSFRGSR